jgi:hypothetical protein
MRCHPIREEAGSEHSLFPRAGCPGQRVDPSVDDTQTPRGDTTVEGAR